jgi:hypothetical protein
MAKAGTCGHMLAGLRRSLARNESLYAGWQQAADNQGAMPQDTTAEYRCPRCHHTLTYVEDVKSETFRQLENLTVPLPSQIYECPEHGSWRLFASGRIEKMDRSRR